MNAYKFEVGDKVETVDGEIGVVARRGMECDVVEPFYQLSGSSIFYFEDALALAPWYRCPEVGMLVRTEAGAVLEITAVTDEYIEAINVRHSGRALYLPEEFEYLARTGRLTLEPEPEPEPEDLEL